jgi:hypothetical protein
VATSRTKSHSPRRATASSSSRTFCRRYGSCAWTRRVREARREGSRRVRAACILPLCLGREREAPAFREPSRGTLARREPPAKLDGILPTCSHNRMGVVLREPGAAPAGIGNKLPTARRSHVDTAPGTSSPEPRLVDEKPPLPHSHLCATEPEAVSQGDRVKAFVGLGAGLGGSAAHLKRARSDPGHLDSKARHFEVGLGSGRRVSKGTRGEKDGQKVTR